MKRLFSLIQIILLCSLLWGCNGGLSDLSKENNIANPVNSVDFKYADQLTVEEYEGGYVAIHISDGQKQRALLARAIAQEPRLMLLDEPTSYLDIYHKLKFIDILKELSKENNIGILMSVHELEIAFEISDKIICNKGGAPWLKQL